MTEIDKYTVLLTTFQVVQTTEDNTDTLGKQKKCPQLELSLTGMCKYRVCTSKSRSKGVLSRRL